MAAKLFGNAIFKEVPGSPGTGARSERYGGEAGTAANTGTADDATAIGSGAQATGEGPTAVGAGAAATAASGLATSIGWGASANQVGAIALGKGATAGHARAVAIGTESATTADDTVTVGLVGGSSTQKKALQVSAGFAAFGGVVPSTQPAHIPDPTGGAPADAEARAAINLILSALEGAGIIANS